MEPGRDAAVLRFVVRRELVGEGRHDAGPVRVLRGEAGAQRLEQHLRLEQLPVRRGPKVEVQRGCPGQVRRLDGSDRRPATRARLEPDKALDLQQPERLAQRRAAHPVLLAHRRLEGQAVARSQTLGHDVVHDLPGHSLGRLDGPALVGVAADVAHGHARRSRVDGRLVLDPRRVAGRHLVLSPKYQDDYTPLHGRGQKIIMRNSLTSRVPDAWVSECQRLSRSPKGCSRGRRTSRSSSGAPAAPVARPRSRSRAHARGAPASTWKSD